MPFNPNPNQHRLLCELINWYNDKILEAFNRHNWGRCNLKYLATKNPNSTLIRNPAYEPPRPYPRFAQPPSNEHILMPLVDIDDFYE
jgi:hypothetical protein